MSMYENMKVSLSLGDLYAIYCAANCFESVDKKHKAWEKRNADLMVENERLVKENNNLRCELSTRPREIAEDTKTAISNAKEALAAHYRPITSEDNLANETVPGDRFHTVYKALRVLVDCLEQEGLS